jgi:hypothetical protein
MRLLLLLLCASLALMGCSPSSESVSAGGPGQLDQGQPPNEVELPPSLSPEASFELVTDTTVEDMFALSTGGQVRPLMLSYQGGLFFLVLDVSAPQYFPLQGGSDLRMAVSTDGYEWAVSDQSIFRYSEGQAFAFRPYSMLVLADGSYALYGGATARTIETIQTWASQYAILRATALNPMEEWSIQPEPVLLPGDVNSWDRIVVWSPYVFPESDGYRMYYWGQPNTDFNADNGVGVALSEDGIEWQKILPGGSHQTGAEPESNLLLSRSQPEWVEIILLHVWRTLDGWQMMYFLRDRRDGGLPHLAFSRDGIDWTPLEGDLQLPESTTPDDVIYASLTYALEHYWMIYCVGVDNTFCYLANTSE